MENEKQQEQEQEQVAVIVEGGGRGEEKEEDKNKREDRYDDTEDEEDEDFVPEKENDKKEGDDDDDDEETFDESADNEGIKKPKKQTSDEPEEKQKPEEKQDAQSLYARLKATCAVKKPPAEAERTEKKAAEDNDKNKKVTVTTVYDFAGEKVSVTKEVSATTLGTTKPVGQKRGGGGGLLSSILGPKPKKMSTLDKSKLDWQKYKTSTGISESLDKIKKSNDSFLEKKAFLNRTEQRQYEIEREIRLSKKK